MVQQQSGHNKLDIHVTEKVLVRLLPQHENDTRLLIQIFALDSSNPQKPEWKGLPVSLRLETFNKIHAIVNGSLDSISVLYGSKTE